MDFSIITPSFKQLDWLELCAASIADQRGVTLEHIVQDGGSGPSIEDWRNRRPSIQVIVEADSGMYDAVNKGLERANGAFCAYLNCDEQYLPDALTRVAQYFSDNPEIDIVFADAIVVSGSGEYMCQRQTLVPNALHTATCHLNTFTCSTFFRRSIVDRKLLFDPALRDLGDAKWILTLIKEGLRMGHLPVFTTAFTDTGDNMNTRPNAHREAMLVRKNAGIVARILRPVTAWHHRLRRLRAGYYRPDKLNYAIYTKDSPSQRQTFRVENPTFIWPKRLKAFQ